MRPGIMRVCWQNLHKECEMMDRSPDAEAVVTKIAVVLRNDLEPWQRLNVTAFTISGVAAQPGALGEYYEDA